MDVQIKNIPAKATWRLRHQVMWPNKPLQYVMLPEDPQGTHFGLFKNEELITVVSLFINNDTAQFRKLATKTTEQGKGYGSQILNHLFKEAQGKGIKKIWCNARSDKTGFYHQFGLHTTAKTFAKDHINYVIMEKDL